MFSTWHWFTGSSLDRIPTTRHRTRRSHTRILGPPRPADCTGGTYVSFMMEQRAPAARKVVLFHNGYLKEPGLLEPCGHSHAADARASNRQPCASTKCKCRTDPQPPPSSWEPVRPSLSELPCVGAPSTPIILLLFDGARECESVGCRKISIVPQIDPSRQGSLDRTAARNVVKVVSS